jgi:hypothetical protein
MNHQLRIRSTGDFYQHFFEVGVTGADTFREPAEGFSTTSMGSALRASRTDSVSRGSSISLFTLESVVLALFAGFVLFCIVKCSQGSFAESVLNSSHRVSIESAISGRVGPRHTADRLVCNHSAVTRLFHPRL